MRKGIAEAEIGAGDAGDKEGDMKKDEGEQRVWPWAAQGGALHNGEVYRRLRNRAA